MSQTILTGTPVPPLFRSRGLYVARADETAMIFSTDQPNLRKSRALLIVCSRSWSPCNWRRRSRRRAWLRPVRSGRSRTAPAPGPAESPTSRSFLTRLVAIGLALSRASSNVVCARSTIADGDRPRLVSPPSVSPSTSTKMVCPSSEGNSTIRFIASSPWLCSPDPTAHHNAALHSTRS
jgi:hypothetical protein